MPNCDGNTQKTINPERDRLRSRSSPLLASHARFGSRSREPELGRSCSLPGRPIRRFSQIADVLNFFSHNNLSGASVGVAQRAADVESDQEQEFVRRARAGDRTAFAALVDRYWHPVRAWLAGLTASEHAAEDLAQEAFLKAWVALPNLVAEETFRVWVFRIARNEYLATLRRRNRITGPLTNRPDPAAGPVFDAIAREEEAALRQAVGKLPASYREAYLLWTHENLSYPELAAVLEVTEETARWRVCEARRRLTRILEKFLKP